MKRLLLLLMLVGCSMSSASTDVVTLTAAQTGDRVLLTLRNGSAAPVGYNLCSSELQRRTGSGWDHVETGGMCTMEIRMLPAGESATFEHTLPSGSAAGEYRYVTRAEGAMVESNPFSIR